MNPNIITDRRYAPPPYRYEAPPPAAYDWHVVPSEIIQSAEAFRQQCVDSSIKINNQLEYTHGLLR